MPIYLDYDPIKKRHYYQYGTSGHRYYFDKQPRSQQQALDQASRQLRAINAAQQRRERNLKSRI